MERVAVVGSGGSGKTTFAETLRVVTGLPLVHLDEQYWHPGWVETPRDEWQTLVRGLVADERWIIDGNYGGTFDVRFERADTVIVLALARRICIYRVLKRVVRNWHRPTQAPGCPERADLSFLLWLWCFPRDARPQLDEALNRHRERVDVVELTTRRAVRGYLDGLAHVV